MKHLRLVSARSVWRSLLLCAGLGALLSVSAQDVRSYNQLHQVLVDASPKAQYNLGVMYYHGRGAPQDFRLAAQWFLRAAAQGHVLAQYELAQLYENGQGVPKEPRLAVQWYREAAVQGHVQAQNNLAMLYENGVGVPQDHGLAFEWLRKAAAQDYPLAQYNLGVMYFQGSGVEQDREQAAYWYGKAAQQGDPVAQYNLGLMFYNGQGVVQGYPVAYALVNLALANGLPQPWSRDATETKRDIAKHLSPEEVKQAQNLSSEWLGGAPMLFLYRRR